jgi:hypothetical protein
MFAAGAGVVVIILVFLLIKGCASIQQENAFKDYVRQVSADVQQSQQESDAVFGLLRKQQGQSAVDLQNNINGFRAEAVKLAERARNRSAPGELSGTNRYLVDTLQLRADGLGALAQLLPQALGDQGAGPAIARIAAQNRLFDASDVLFTQRFLPGLFKTIKDQGLASNVTIPAPLRQPKGFLPDVNWLRPGFVASALTGTGAAAQGPATPGTHGTGLVSVTVQPTGTTLSPTGTTAVRAQRGLSFDVQVQNQGQNDEKNVIVKVTVSGAGTPIAVEQPISTLKAGATATASVPLPTLPPTGRPVTIAVSVSPVAGEKNTTNNKQTYQAIFTSA